MQEIPPMAPFGTAEDYFAATGASRVLGVPTCRKCGKRHWYPRLYCPFCLSEEIYLIRASGRATVYSFSVVRRAAEPYVVAIVELEEGPMLMTNIVDCEVDSISVGQAVELTFIELNSATLPAFTVAAR